MPCREDLLRRTIALIFPGLPASADEYVIECPCVLARFRLKVQCDHISLRMFFWREAPNNLWVNKVELRIGDKGRITLPTKILKALSLREGDVLELDARGRAIILRPRGASVSETKGVAGKFEVDLEEIEESIGKEGELRFIDSNVFVYHLPADPRYGRRATAILQSVEDGEETVTSTLSIA